MSKTPEEMAEEYADDKSRAYYIGENGEKKWYISSRGQHSKEDFLAGYEAAKEQVADEIAAIRESWSASKVNELIYENAQLTAKLSTIRNK